jgi:hypothetical protein
MIAELEHKIEEHSQYGRPALIRLKEKRRQHLVSPCLVPGPAANGITNQVKFEIQGLGLTFKLEGKILLLDQPNHYL